MKLLLLGGTGLAGIALRRELSSKNYDVLSVARKNADINLDIGYADNLSALLKKENPDAVINAAAIVNMEHCRENYSDAWNINCRIPDILGKWSKRNSKPFLQISTDHLFQNDNNIPNNEQSLVSLVNDYASQKYAAEFLSLNSPKSLILRTSIIGIRGWNEKTFAEWIICSITNQKEIILFEDAWTSAIDTDSFAKVAVELFFEKECRGLLNLGASEVFSKGDLIREFSRQLDISLVNEKISSIHDHLSDRASTLGLDVSKVEELLGRKMPSMKQVVTNVLLRRN